MFNDVIDRTLQLMTPDELSRLLWSVDVWVRAGQMTEAEAAAWRERIRVWQRFRRPEEQEQPVAGRSSFFAEEPNPFGFETP